VKGQVEIACSGNAVSFFALSDGRMSVQFGAAQSEPMSLAEFREFWDAVNRELSYREMRDHDDTKHTTESTCP